MGKAEKVAAYPGIPREISLDYARRWAKPRTSEKRFRHVEGVASTARILAKKCSPVDPFLAELSGWLHDACKEIKAAELFKMAKDFGLPLEGFDESNGHLLHGPVAAAVIRTELSITNESVLAAISEHTLGAVDMTDLSKVVYLADCLEESRPSDFTDPIWNALGWRPGAHDESGRTELDLNRAILVACDLGLQYLLEDGRPIHLKTVAVRNHFLSLVKAGADLK